MIFESYSLVGGGLEHGHELNWHRSKNGGHYNRHQDFFWVHWEIGDAKPCSIKFHVESPRVDVDAELNGIKQDMVSAFLSADFECLATQCGYNYKRGGRTKPEHMERFKCTEAFRVVLKPEQCQGNHRANIETVNAAMGPTVRAVLERFAARLNAHFPLERD